MFGRPCQENVNFRPVVHDERISPRITRRPGPLKVDDICCVGSRVHAVVMCHRKLDDFLCRRRGSLRTREAQKEDHLRGRECIKAFEMPAAK